MSLKPPKKSDLKKPWMNKPDRAIKIRPEYHLIVTEGTDTEPAYFGAIQEIINKQYPEKIQLKVFGLGDNTVSLFEKAKIISTVHMTRIVKDSIGINRALSVILEPLFCNFKSSYLLTVNVVLNSEAILCEFIKIVYRRVERYSRRVVYLS